MGIGENKVIFHFPFVVIFPYVVFFFSSGLEDDVVGENFLTEHLQAKENHYLPYEDDGWASFENVYDMDVDTSESLHGTNEPSEDVPNDESWECD